MKNKFSLNKILTVLMLFLAIFSISSCSRDSDSPQAPTDETKDRGHEMPDRVEFIFKNMLTIEVPLVQGALSMGEKLFTNLY